VSATVFVNGANGHLGFNLAKSLLERGYKVRCSVRDPGNDATVAHLAAAGLTDIVALDVTDGERFTQVCKGIDILFHVAATYKYWTPTQASVTQLLRDSTEGALNAVRAAAANDVRKLVFTSSIVTLPLTDSPQNKVDETRWRTDLRVPYFRAKTEAERLAWDLSREAGLEMVAVLPAAIIGPGFKRHTTSTMMVENIMRGAFRTGAPRLNFPAVDVRDVVEGHILAAESDVTGRFIICNDEVMPLRNMIMVMHRIDRRIPKSWCSLPNSILAFGTFFDWLNAKTLGTHRALTSEFLGSVKGKWWAFSNERAKQALGWQQRISLSQSLADTISAIRELNS